MRFFSSLVGAALATAAFALEINSFPGKVEAGNTYEITYSPADNTPTTFLLRKGKDTDLTTVGEPLTESAVGGKFSWKVDDSLTNGVDYALEIRQGSVNNYIGPIAVTGGEDAVSSAASSSAAASTASSSAAESTTVVTLTTTASIAVSSSSTNGSATLSLPTLSSTRAPANPTTSGAGSPTTGAGAPNNTGAASSLGSSPMALVLGAVAAMAYLN